MKRRYIIFAVLLSASCFAVAQNVMTPELLWKLGRLSAKGITRDGKNIIYTVSTPDVSENKSKRSTYLIPVTGGNAVQISNSDSLLVNSKISPDGKYIIYDKEVLIKKVKSADIYGDLPKSNAYVFDNLNYRHWDEWEDGKFNHVFVAQLLNGQRMNEKDIMEGEPYDAPQKPFGGEEDYVWSPDSRSVIYVTKKKYGTEYAISTNTDLYKYDLVTGKTTNLTEGMLGYDIQPSFSSKGVLAWLSMKREGYEADKQDLIISINSKKINLTSKNDAIHVNGYKWSNDGESIFFWSAVKGTEQLFQVKWNNNNLNTSPVIRQITKGDYQFTEAVGEANGKLIATAVTFNAAPELYSVDIETGSLQKLTSVNDAIYASITPVTATMRWVKTTDNKQMPVWVVYPPNFDSTKKYPTILFCLGGPQGNTPFYSYRWNFQLMASQGYIVVAPERRGVYGLGTQWVEQVSKGWNGIVMQDYLVSIDNVSKEKYVDKTRLGCVGASFGGYSVYMLESTHNGRFKTFIAHDGIFDYRSMYGSTEELFFENWEKGGNYWDKKNTVAQRSFAQSPSNFVEKWNTPIMVIHGGKDYRVPLEQGLQAFQAAQLKGIKSRFLYLPEENHWVLSAQNAQVWQREFFRWLKETL